MSAGQVKIDESDKWLLDAALDALEQTWQNVEVDEVTEKPRKHILRAIQDLRKKILKNVKLMSKV
jgi:hypothetical protein